MRPSWDAIAKLLEKHYIKDLSRYSRLTMEFCEELFQKSSLEGCVGEFHDKEYEMIKILILYKYDITVCENCGYYKKSKI